MQVVSEKILLFRYTKKHPDDPLAQMLSYAGHLTPTVWLTCAWQYRHRT